LVENESPSIPYIHTFTEVTEETIFEIKCTGGDDYTDSSVLTLVVSYDENIEQSILELTPSSGNQDTVFGLKCSGYEG